jgi:hypothetical protein
MMMEVWGGGGKTSPESENFPVACFQ